MGSWTALSSRLAFKVYPWTTTLPCLICLRRLVPSLCGPTSLQLLAPVPTTIYSPSYLVTSAAQLSKSVSVQDFSNPAQITYTQPLTIKLSAKSQTTLLPWFHPDTTNVFTQLSEMTAQSFNCQACHLYTCHSPPLWLVTVLPQCPL